MKSITSSSQRYCHFYKTKNETWYMELANMEHGDREDATTYGPFPSEDAAVSYLRNFSNPGGYSTDEGSSPVPTRSPNGGAVVRPNPLRGRGYFGSAEAILAVAKELANG